MDMDEKMRPKIALSLGAVAVLVIAFVGIGVTFGGAGLSLTGGYALVAALAGFVLLMGALGAFLSMRD